MKTREEIVAAIAHAFRRTPKQIDELPDIEDLVDALNNGDCIDKEMCGRLLQTMCGSLKTLGESGRWQTLHPPALAK